MLNVNKNTIILSVAALVLLSIDVSFAHTTYGSQLMSPKERAEHRAKMMSLPPSEREAYRTEHHKVMKERAESMGLSMPGQPPAQRGFGRRGPGYGYGRGGRGYWEPGYRRAAPWYGGRGYGTWHDRGRYGPGYGGRGYPAW